MIFLITKSSLDKLDTLDYQTRHHLGLTNSDVVLIRHDHVLISWDLVLICRDIIFVKGNYWGRGVRRLLALDSIRLLSVEN